MNMRDRVRFELERDEMATLQQVGDRIGISREYVRQLAKEIGIDVRARQRARTEAKAVKQSSTFCRRRWVATVRRWLKAIGCGYCASCHEVKPLYQMGSTKERWNPSRCGACCAKSVKLRPSQQPDARRKYQREHREQCNANSAAYMRKKLSKIYAEGGEALAAYRAAQATKMRIYYWRKRGVDITSQESRNASQG